MAAEALADSRAGTLSSPSGPRPAVVVEGLVRRFGERHALSGVNVSLGETETLALFGPNGAGKTTLLRVLATLLMPHSGTVRVLGHALPREAHAVRALVGLAGHEPLLYRDLSGRENLRFYGRLYGIDALEQRVQELLERTRMSARADEPLRSLSRGMVQRLALARAVLHRPQLLLLDEPWAGLDPDAVDLVEPLIGRGGDRARVLVTHDIEHGLAEADRVLGLRDGAVVIDAPAEQITPGDVRAIYGHAGLRATGARP